MKTAKLTHEQIAERAYQIHLANGRQNGHDRDDWLQAEYELLARPVKARRRFHGRGLTFAATIAVAQGAIILSQAAAVAQ